MAQVIDIDGFLQKLASGRLNEARNALGLDLYYQRASFTWDPLSR